MKFQLIALAATAQAIKIRGSSGGPPDCNQVADMVFDHCDANHDGGLTWKEASGCGAPAQFKPEFDKAAGADGSLDHAEFVAGCEAHTGLAQDQCEDVGEQILKHCDKDGNDQISWKEASGCGAPKAWKGKFLKIAGADKEIDGKEFLSACRGGEFSLAQSKGSSGGPPDCDQVADMVFDHCDANHDGGLTWKEASGCGAPAQFKPEFDKAAGADKSLDHDEFVAGCEAHTGLAQDQCEDVGEQILKHCDKDGNDQISWKEARGCGAPKAWKKKFLKIAGADKEIDGKEFLGACRGGAFN